jgi:hypothetical protein
MSLWVAGAVVVGAGINAAAGSKSASKAANAQTQAAETSAEVIRQNFEDTQKTLQPYVDAGIPAIDRQQALLGLKGPEAQQAAREQLYSGPGFQYQKDQVIGDVNRSASSLGMLRSGNRLAALTERLQGLYATQEGNYLNQLGAQTGVGLSGASALAGVGQNAAAGQAQAIQYGGNAAAQGIMNRSQAIQGGISDLAGGIGYLGRSGAFGGGGSAGGYGWQGNPQINAGVYG